MAVNAVVDEIVKCALNAIVRDAHDIVSILDDLKGCYLSVIEEEDRAGEEASIALIVEKMG